MTTWHSTDKELPPHSNAVLCWYEYFRYGSYNRMYQDYGIGYCINGIWGGEVSNGRRTQVLAWMELPEPPKIEEAEQTNELREALDNSTIL